MVIIFIICILLLAFVCFGGLRGRVFTCAHHVQLVTVLLAHPTSSEEKLMGPSPGGPAIGRKLTLQVIFILG